MSKTPIKIRSCKSSKKLKIGVFHLLAQNLVRTIPYVLRSTLYLPPALLHIRNRIHSRSYCPLNIFKLWHTKKLAMMTKWNRGIIFQLIKIFGIVWEKLMKVSWAWLSFYNINLVPTICKNREHLKRIYNINIDINTKLSR